MESGSLPHPPSHSPSSPAPHAWMAFSSFPIQQAACHTMSPAVPVIGGDPGSIQVTATIESRQQMLEGHSKQAQTQWSCCQKEQAPGQLWD